MTICEDRLRKEDEEKKEFDTLKEQASIRIASKEKCRLCTRGEEGVCWNGYVIATSPNWVKFEREEVMEHSKKVLRGIRFFPICNVEYIEVLDAKKVEQLGKEIKETESQYERDKDRID